MVRGLTKAMQLSLLVESRILSKEAATEIRACLEKLAGETDPCRSYTILKRWYRHASVRVHIHSQTNMDKVRGDFRTLYQWEDQHPTGLTLGTHVNPVQVNNTTQSEA